MKTLVVVVGTMIALCGLAACQKHETASDNRADVAKAQSEASKDVAEARKDADAKVADASKDRAASQVALGHEVAKTDEDVALTAAKGAHKVATERCEALTGDARSMCKRQADADLDSATARAHQGRAATDPKP